MESNFAWGSREIGHIHGDHLVDIPLPTRVRHEIVGTGQAQAHHILPDSGWVSLYLREAADIVRALTLLRRSYELAAHQKARRRRSATTTSQSSSTETIS